MANVLSYKSKAEICAFLEYDERIRLPSAEWSFIAKHYVLRGNWNDPKDLPSIKYFSSEGFRVALGKCSLGEAMDIVFSAGEPLLLWFSVPHGFIEAVIKRHSASGPRPPSMREVTIAQLNICDVWLDAYYTSFPCHKCSHIQKGTTDTKKGADCCEVFHVTYRERLRDTLSVKYTYRFTSKLVETKDQRIEVTVGRPDCYAGGLLRSAEFVKSQVLSLSELRAAVFQFLPRSALDACLLVGRQWKAQVEELSEDLALRELESVQITFKCEKETATFFVSVVDNAISPIRYFTLPRGDAQLDCAVVVNHLRNCVTLDDSNCFSIEIDGPLMSDDEADDERMERFARWVQGMLGSLTNFSCGNVDLQLEYLETFYVVEFLETVHPALEACTWSWLLLDLWLQIEHSALQVLVEERFIEWEFIQRLRLIRIEASIFGADPLDDPTWIRCLFQLPACLSLDIVYWTKDLSGQADRSAYVFVVLSAIMQEFADAPEVNGFVQQFGFILRQPMLTWTHEEPTPAHSNVHDSRFSGLWNVYETKNKATDEPLSVLLSSKENSQVEAGEEQERVLIFRKERYKPPTENPRRQPDALP